MVKPHVARLAGLRLTGFLGGEGMSCVARIAGSHAEARAGLSYLPDVGFAL
jgi:hypothetical protein